MQKKMLKSLESIHVFLSWLHYCIKSIKLNKTNRKATTSIPEYFIPQTYINFTLNQNLLQNETKSKPSSVSYP